MYVCMYECATDTMRLRNSLYYTIQDNKMYRESMCIYRKSFPFFLSAVVFLIK